MGMQYAAVVGACWFSAVRALAIRWCLLQGYVLDSSRLVCASECAKIAAVVVVVKFVLGRPLFPGPWKPGFAVCALLYMGTNLLEYVILRSTSVGTYMVLIQHKAATIMLLSTAVLGKQYSVYQWAAGVALVAGVACTRSGVVDVSVSSAVLILTQGLCSALAGVWIEKTMKANADEDPLYAFLVDSLQLYLMGLPLYACMGIANPGPHTLPVWTSAALAANGACAGLFVGAVFKYFSATTRAFVQGASVALSVWLGTALLGEVVSRQAGWGTAVVIAAIVLFATSAPSTATSTIFNLKIYISAPK